MNPDPGHPFKVGLAVASILVTGSVTLFWLFGADGGATAPPTLVTSTTAPIASEASDVDTTPTTGSTIVGTTVITVPTTTSSTIPDEPPHDWVDRRTIGEPWGSVEGLLMFRGNPTNTWYGTGPIPRTPVIDWRFPDSPMCSQSTDLGVTSTWCGNGWTGQPVIWERPDGITEMIFGAYDGRLHFVDAEIGTRTRSPIQTGDIVKGTPTIDPDGFPLVYFGSRDNKLRIIALDRNDPFELWSVESDGVNGRWNDDWDANPRIINDILLEGSEDSFFYIWKLNRRYDELGLVQVEPELLLKLATWDEDLLQRIGQTYPATSVENSAVVFEGTVYFANSAGRIIGLDITDAESGNIPIVFDYWVGDDVDASLVVDREGMLYVSVEYERYLERAKTLGQLIKLDPTAGDPYVWGMFSLTDPPAKGGMWATPALGDGVLYAVTNKGFLVVVDQQTGEELWVTEIGHGSWSSPAVVDGKLIVGSSQGVLRVFDIGDPRNPVIEWTFEVGGAAIEATPAVWKGRIYVGSRDGFMYAVADQNG